MQSSSAHVRPVAAEHGTPKASINSRRSRLPPPSVSVVSARSFGESIWVMETDLPQMLPSGEAAHPCRACATARGRKYLHARGDRGTLCWQRRHAPPAFFCKHTMWRTQMCGMRQKMFTAGAKPENTCFCPVNNLLAISTRTLASCQNKQRPGLG